MSAARRRTPGSAGALLSAAISHVKLGDLLGNPNFPNVGDAAGAVEQYHAALTTLEALPADSAAAWAPRRYLGLVHERLGAMHQLAGRHVDALREFGASLAFREQLAAEAPTSTDALRDVAVTHNNLCEVQLAPGDAGAALPSCRQALELYRRLRAADPSNVQSLRDLAIGHRALGEVLAARGELAAAVAELGRGTELFEEFLRSNPDDISTRRELGRTLLRASAAHTKLATAGPQRAGAERERARMLYERGREVLTALGTGGTLAAEDANLLTEAGAALGRLPAQP